MLYRPVLPNADVKGSFIQFSLKLLSEIFLGWDLELMLKYCVAIWSRSAQLIDLRVNLSVILRIISDGPLVMNYYLTVPN